MITSDFAAGTTGSMLQVWKSSSTGNVASTLQAYTAGASAYGNIALNANGGNVGICTNYPLFINSPIYKTVSEYINYATL